MHEDFRTKSERMWRRLHKWGAWANPDKNRCDPFPAWQHDKNHECGTTTQPQASPKAQSEEGAPLAGQRWLKSDAHTAGVERISGAAAFERADSHTGVFPLPDVLLLS